MTKNLLFGLFLSSVCLNVSAQSDKLMTRVPVEATDYKEMDQSFLNSMAWLETTPIDKFEEKRKKQMGYILSYCMGSPDITLTLNATFIDFNKKNTDFLVFFLGGWARYCINNNYKNNEIKGTVAGLESVIAQYKTGQYKKDKFVEKLLELEKQGTLEGWVKDNM